MFAQCQPGEPWSPPAPIQQAKGLVLGDMSPCHREKGSASYSIFLFHLIPLPPHDPLPCSCTEHHSGTTGEYDCLRDGFPAASARLGNTPPSTGAHSGARGRQTGLENGPTGKAVLSTLCSGPISCSVPALASPPCSGWHGIPGAGRKKMGAGKGGTLLDAALTSLGHVGPWMLPPALAARGRWGLLEPPPGSGHSRAPHASPAASLCGFWHTRPLRNQRLRHGSQESQGRAAQLPLTHMGHPDRAIHPKAPAGPAALPRRRHGPTNTSGSRDAAPSTKTQH